MRTTTRRTMTATLTLALALTLGACSAEETEGPGVDGTTAGTPAAPSDETPTGDDAIDDATDDVDETDDAGDTDGDDDTDDADDTAGATGGAAAGDLTASGLAAIEAAEADQDGTAVEIDDQDDDGTWEVTVRIGDRTVEVTVGADGEVAGTDDEDDLDAEDIAALDAATTTLAEAIETAVAQTGGVLDDAELDEEDGTYVWKVSVDGTDAGDDDVEVHVDTVSGEVVKTD